jgi:ABC-type multidrug transport system fused ATPase/permease subunit
MKVFTKQLLKKQLVYVVFRILRILNKNDKLKLLILSISQILLSFIDLLGVALIGVIGSLAVSSNTSHQSSGRIQSVLKFLNINDMQVQLQVAILGLFAAICLISKTLFSIYFSRRTLFFLSVRAANITKQLVAKLLNSSLLEVQKRSLQENIYMITGGVGNIISGILGAISAMIADISLVVVMLFGLYYLDPFISLLTIIIFGGILVFLYLFLQNRAADLGSNQAKLSVKSIELIQEVLNSYREAIVGGKRPYYVNRIGKNQVELAKNNARLAFLPSISKYILEITVVFGTLLICGLQFIQNDSTRAVTVLSVFFAASTRIVPALLRIQQSLIYIKGVAAASSTTLEMIETTQDLSLGLTNSEFDTTHASFKSNIQILDVSLRYENSNKFALKNVNIEVLSGESLAIVGRSGAGKTTLVDVMLGIIAPQQGIVKIAGLDPREAIDRWPGAISYLPQNIQIFNGTIRENICTGYELNQISDEDIWRALKIAQLDRMVLSLDKKLDTFIGDQGNKLSGGEKQRLGIARAIVTNPKLLVIDEGTSALDSETEFDITNAIAELKKDATIILIAHRLSSTRLMNKLIYLDSGEIIAQGSFDEVRAKVPEFDKQSRLMGL